MRLVGYLKEILSGSDVGASNYGTTNNDYERTKKDPSYPNLRYCSGICLQGLRITTTILLFSNYENGFDLAVMASEDVRQPTACDRLLMYVFQRKHTRLSCSCVL